MKLGDQPKNTLASTDKNSAATQTVPDILKTIIVEEADDVLLLITSLKNKGSANERSQLPQPHML